MNAFPTWRTRLAAAGAALALGFGGPAAVMAADTPPPTTAPVTGSSFGFAVTPYASAGSLPRDYFEYQLTPGRSVQDRVSIVNSTDKPKDFYVYSADAYNTERGGGFALRLRTEDSPGTAAWVKVPVDHFSVPAKRAALIPIQIVVPTDATPGDHTAGIVAEEVIPASNVDGATGVQTVHRVAARVYLRVSGPIHPGLQVSAFSVSHDNPAIPYAHESRMTVAFTVTNTGNLRLQPDKVTLKITGLLGRTVRQFSLARPPASKAALNPLPDTLLPGSTIRFSKSFTGRFQPFEPLTARATVASEDPIQNRRVSVSRHVRFWVFSLGFLVLVVALALAIAGRWYWRRRRPQGVAPVVEATPSPPSVMTRRRPLVAAGHRPSGGSGVSGGSGGSGGEDG
jgi:hypothetical protein